MKLGQIVSYGHTSYIARIIGISCDKITAEPLLTIQTLNGRQYRLPESRCEVVRPYPVNFLYIIKGDPLYSKEIREIFEQKAPSPDSCNKHDFCKHWYYINGYGNVTRTDIPDGFSWYRQVTYKEYLTIIKNENKLQREETSRPERNESGTGSIRYSRNEFKSSVGHLSNRALNFSNKIRIGGIEE